MECLVSSSAVSKKDFFYQHLNIFKSGSVESLYNQLLLLTNSNGKKNNPKFSKFAKKELSINKISSEWIKLFNE